MARPGTSSTPSSAEARRPFRGPSWAESLGTRPHRAREVASLAAGIGTVLPLGLLVAAVSRNAVNIPFSDEWELLPLLERLRAGHLDLTALWSQHNEHRFFLPRLVLLGLATTTSWDIRWELVVNVVVALVTFAFLVSLLGVTVGRIRPRLVPWLVVPISWTVFSLVQWENWASGWQVGLFMSALGAVVAVWAVARWPHEWLGTLVALGAGAFAALSFMNGVILLWLIPFVLFARGAGSRMIRAAAAFAAALTLLYFRGWQHPSYHPDPMFGVRHPLEAVRYALTYLGAPMEDSTANRAAVIGLIGIVVLADAWRVTRRAASSVRDALAPWYFLAMYAVACAVSTTVGRAGAGAAHALSSRYTTFGGLFWVGVFVSGALSFAVSRPDDHGGWARIARPTALGSASALIVACYAGTWTASRGTFAGHAVATARGAECVKYYRSAPDSCLTLLYPRPIGDRIRTMEKLGLGPFVPGKAPPRLASFVVVPSEDRRFGWLDSPVDGTAAIRHEGHVVLRGWALDPERDVPARAVLVVVDGDVVDRAPVTENRPDVARALDRPDLIGCGWTYRLAGFRLRPGRHVVEAYAVDATGSRAAKLLGARVIEITDA